MDDNKHEVDSPRVFTPFSFKSLRYASFSWFYSQYNISFLIISSEYHPIALSLGGFTLSLAIVEMGLLVFVPRVFSHPYKHTPFYHPLTSPRNEHIPIDGASPSQGYRSKEKLFKRIGYDVSATSP